MNSLLVNSNLKYSKLSINGSKSESNRLLILKSLYKNLSIINISDCDDTNFLENALQESSGFIDIGHAGTAMRFLTSLFSVQAKSPKTISGSLRMKQRPIKILVDALRNIGAEIDYLEKEGFPPLLIKPSIITGGEINIDSSISSQYISSLLLIAPKIKGGLKINLNGKETSLPYIKMTINLLEQIGVTVICNKNTIDVKELKDSIPKEISVESDWSSASYFYSIVAMAPIGFKICLNSFKKDSIQGDSLVKDFFQIFGVQTTFLNDSIIIEKVAEAKKSISLDLSSNPDLAQTICVTCLGLKVSCNLNGLHTLKIKETDRLNALKNELSKFGLDVKITSDSIKFNSDVDLIPNIKIETYDDHRMAMAFSCLSVKTNIKILNSQVVSKSYPSFWSDLSKIGIVSK
tara:strand:+ start:677 stop:1891 length:1215 start_codon:yes stop_codon:yes gene_type:complete